LWLGDERAVSSFHAETFGDVGGDRLNLHAEPTAGDHTLVLELGDHRFYRVGRNIEGDADIAAGRGKDSGVHADHVAVHIERGTAGITPVDRGVDLDEIVIGTGTDVSAARRNNACGHRTAQPERIADRQNPIADPWATVGKMGEREIVAGVDLDQRQVAARIGAHDPGCVRLAIIRRYLDTLGAIDHVIVGHRISISRDEEARSLCGGELPELLVAKTIAIRLPERLSLAETSEEIIEWRAPLLTEKLSALAEAAAEEIIEWRTALRTILVEPSGISASVHLNFDGDHGGFHLVHDVGKAVRALQHLGIGRGKQVARGFGGKTEFADGKAGKPCDGGKKSHSILRQESKRPRAW